MADERDVAARVEEYLPLVKHVVFQVAAHFPRHVDREELARAGALGLLEAAHRWESDRGVPFDRFAARRIRGSILDAVRASDWAPRSVRNAARSLEAGRQQLSADLGRTPTTEELAEGLGMTTEQLRRQQDRVFRAVILNLNEHVTTDEREDLRLVDILCDRTAVEPSEELETRELHAYLRDAIRYLPERHRLVIVGYFLEGRTSLELARFLGVTESRVSQLRSEALEMLHDGITAQFDGRAEEPAPAKGRVARRKAAYAAAIAGGTGWKDRLSSSKTPAAV